MRTGRLARSRAAVVAAVVLALAVAGWQATIHWSDRNPEPDAAVETGETARIGDATYRLDRFEVAERLPAADSEQEWVVAPDGAALVQVVLTTEIGDAVDPDEHYCDPTAVDGAEREWNRDSDVGYSVAGPEALTCGGPSDAPIRPGEPLAVGFVFLVPDDAVDTLVVDVALGHEDAVLRLMP